MVNTVDDHAVVCSAREEHSHQRVVWAEVLPIDIDEPPGDLRLIPAARCGHAAQRVGGARAIPNG